MIHRTYRPALAAAALVATALLALPAEAHTYGTHGAGFAAGLSHPMQGIDHLLVMLAVGVLAAARGGRALIGLPAAFVATMTAGAALAFAGIVLPFAESMITLSLLVAGGLLALGGKVPGRVLSLAIAGFALFHGAAHGAEIPLAASPWAYAGGFILGATLLHGAGILLAHVLRRIQAPFVPGASSPGRLDP